MGIENSVLFIFLMKNSDRSLSLLCKCVLQSWSLNTYGTCFKFHADKEHSLGFFFVFLVPSRAQ